jgi:hypothetical protein
MAERIFSCPVPNNINPLSPVGFQFSIQKLPSLSFFCQEVNLPGLTLGEPEFVNPFARVPIPGETITYDQLIVQFLVDEDMKNYKSIYDWIIALGFPEEYDQYTSFIDSEDRGIIHELAKNYSDGTLTILNNNNRPAKTLQFIDMFPTNLDTLQFTSTQQDVQYLIGRATFRFSYYKFI